ncbi:MAG TPA: glycosyltransferase family 1 protein [Pseudomonadales bacterium]|nr:glycosyltransferase family 1 protein [Pseudomonadales bacterium]
MNSNPTIHFLCEKGHCHFAKNILKKLDLLCISKEYVTKIGCLWGTVGAEIIWAEWASNGALIASRYKRPWQKLVVRLHKYELYRSKRMKRIRWANVDCVIFVNSELEATFKELVDRSVPTVTIPNALDVDRFQLSEITAANSIVSYSITFSEVKAYHKLIQLIKAAVQLVPDIKLTIAAQRPITESQQNYHDRCAELVDMLDLSSVVKFQYLEINPNELEVQNNIKKLLKTHNAVISYSDIESFHYSFAEGLLSGLQGFCRGWGEISLKEFWDNWIYENEEDFLSAIVEWANTSVSERKRIALENRKYVINSFSADSVAKKFRELFRSL